MLTKKKGVSIFMQLMKRVKSQIWKRLIMILGSRFPSQGLLSMTRIE